MKLSCLNCAAKYTISDERLNGRRVKVRCKRCGEVFAVDGAETGVGAVETPAESVPETRPEPLFSTTPDEVVTSAPPHLVGERNETSVLFSLATLSAMGGNRAETAGAETSRRSDANANQTTATTESSGLIDIRALARVEASLSSSRSSSSSHAADDIMNLSGGGAFASPLLAPALPPVARAVEEDAPGAQGVRSQRALLSIGAISVVVASVAVVAIVISRGGSATPAVAAAAAPTTTNEGVSTSAVDTAPLSPSSASTQTVEPTAPRASARVATRAVTTTTTTTTATAATTTAAPTPASATALSKCCPGETETTCQMRLSVGAACGDRAAISSNGSAPPFDRSAAARALGAVNVSSCKRADGPTGSGHVKVTFLPNGTASAVDLDPPYAGTGVGTCISQRYRSVSIPAFSGSTLGVGKTFTIQ